MRSATLAVSVLAAAAACSGAKSSTTPAPAPAPAPTASAEPAPAGAPEAEKPADKHTWAKTMSLAETGIVPGWIDKSADPCTDFFQYACGGFLATATIPPDRSSWGAIELVVKDAEDTLHAVLEDAAKAPSGGDPVIDKVGSYYAACMDESAIERAGLAPIQPLLDRIAKITDAPSAIATVIALHQDAVFPLFGISPQQDFQDATQMVASLDQTGLGLPDRKYYLENKGTMAKTRAAYVAHLGRMFKLAGQDDKTAKASAAEAMRFETKLARLQQDEVVRRDPHAVYHPIGRAGLEKIAPGFPWGDYLQALNLANVTAITVHDPAYYTQITKLVTTEKPATLRTYLTEVLLRDSADDLSKAWVDESFEMHKVLTGAKELPPRWRRCYHRVDHDLGELLGQSYVKIRFGGDAKGRAVELTKSILGAMRAELDNLPWMDDATRGAAKQKLDKMAYLAGFPEKWRKYDFEIKRTDYAGNVQAATKFELARQLAKIGKPVDRFDWGMTPPTVNAYYDPSLNEIVLPAGQLQPPFFGATFHPAVNFGSTGGGTIGHEMTHGFDDEGSQFDADGNLRDWWSKSTKDQFATATKCVVDQYSKYEAVPKVYLDGKLTAGENIADNGGVKLAFQAYQSWKTQQTPPPPAVVEGVTDDQLYFLAYGQSWCEKMTQEVAETRAHSNPHSPARWRVNGVIVNQPGFGPAFKCAAGTPMNPGKQCSVW